MRKVLLLGAGNSRNLHLAPLGKETEPAEIVTTDVDPFSKPDVWCDLNFRPLPFGTEEFDEIHAYEVLEHLGKQGDWRGFFDEFSEYWRILKPDGFLLGSCPAITSPWLWGDPGHSRTLQPETLSFLQQSSYIEQVGVTHLTDYRKVYKADFKVVMLDTKTDQFWFGLQAVKPSRWRLP